MTAQSTALAGGRGTRPGMPTVQQAYLAYVALGPERSLEKVRTKFAAEQPPLSVSIKTLKRWCRSESWLAKAEAEDRKMKAEAGVQIALVAGEAVADAALRLGITHGYILEGLKDIKERCMQAEPVLDSEGNPTGEYRFDAKGALGALKLMGETISTFQAAPPPNPNGGTTINGNVILGGDVAAEIRAMMREYDPLATPPPIDISPNKPD